MDSDDPSEAIVDRVDIEGLATDSVIVAAVRIPSWRISSRFSRRFGSDLTRSLSEAMSELGPGRETS